jgi:hypothetical protein
MAFLSEILGRIISKIDLEKAEHVMLYKGKELI